MINQSSTFIPSFFPKKTNPRLSEYSLSTNRDEEKWSSLYRCGESKVSRDNKRDSANFAFIPFRSSKRISVASGLGAAPPRIRGGFLLDQMRNWKIRDAWNLKTSKTMVRPFLFCPVAVIWPACPLVLSRPGIKPRWHRRAGSLA